MPRLYLLDFGLRDAATHHWRYALTLGQAAVQRGYQPVVAMGTGVGPEVQFPAGWRVEPVFRDGHARNFGLTSARATPHGYGLDGASLAEEHRGWWAAVCDWGGRHDRRGWIERRAEDLALLFQRVPPRTGDVFFLPTVHDFDFLGAVRFWRDHAWTTDFDWHLQFHEAVYSGRDPEFPAEETRLRAFQSEFRAAVDEIPQHRLHFYTTTPALARQWNALGIAIFHPLPWAVRTGNAELVGGRSWTPGSGPCRVVLPGGLREEKGCQRATQLLDAVWEPLLENGRAQLCFQADIPQVEAIVPPRLRGRLQVARAASPAAGEAPVTAAVHPMGADEYEAFLGRAQIGLLLHDARRYFARVSGVLSELLAVGVPTIVPAGCWLADQVAEEGYRYLDLWRRSHPAGAMVAERVAAKDPATAEFVANFAAPTLAGFWQVDWQSGEHSGEYLAVSITAEGTVAGPSTILGPRSNGPVGAAWRWDRPVQHVRFTCRGAYSGSTLRLQRFRVWPFDVAADEVPRSRTALVHAHEEEIPQLLEEMVAHYTHYRQTAVSFGRLWRTQHDPNVTLDLLLDRSMAGSSAHLVSAAS